MHLARLEVRGFKSFPKKTILEFPAPRGAATKGITAIVGPNGSGKSNVADAIRWALGERATSTLRGKKAQDVIFAGSERVSRSGLAEVSLVFSGAKARFPLDSDEVTITRSFARDDEGEIRVNGARVRFGELANLLASAQFGSASYQVVSQGMVDAILLVSPWERKAFFDEATGIRVYELKREEAVRKLARTEENLREAKLLLQEIAPRLRSLTRQIKRLERREEVENHLRELERDYFGGRWSLLQQELGTVRGEVARTQTREGKARGELISLEKELAALEIESQKKGASGSLQQTYDEHRQRKKKLTSEIATLEKELAAGGGGGEYSKAWVHWRRELLSLLEQFQEHLMLLLARLERGESVPPRDIKTVRAGYAELCVRAKMDPLSRIEESERPRHEEKLATLRKELAGEEERIHTLLEQVERVSEEERIKRLQLIALEKQYRTLQESHSAASGALHEVELRRVTLETRAEDLRREMREELSLEMIQEVERAASRFHSAQGDEAKLAEILRFKRQLELIGGVEEGTKEEEAKTRERFEFLSSQVEDLEKAGRDLKRLITELEETIGDRFRKSFAKINEQFGRYFKMLFAGGRASLSLTKRARASKEVPLENGVEGTSAQGEEARGKEQEEMLGVEIGATPPGKRLKGISMLSGGERALTSIALLAAIIHHNPSPFVMLDEVDAALDDHNSVRFAAILEGLSKRTQIIIITHNRATMEKAHVLYGVTMGEDGISKLLSLKLEDARVFKGTTERG